MENTTETHNDSVDTICAIATAPGRGGIGVIRISGPQALSLSKKILKTHLKPRTAHYGNFFSRSDHVIDRGISLYFANPNSFTGEDVVEFQAHGGPIILDMLMKELAFYGARLARPGEFSERAFLNDKIDLTQAEAIADLINANSEQAAKQALNSLKGEFSKYIDELVSDCINLRMYVESSIDFPEEEIDFLADSYISKSLAELIAKNSELITKAQQGVLLKEGMKVVLAGRPNAGKSSLLNRLAEQEIAIVTDMAGTTRDVLKEHIHINGMPIHIVDTAGIREGSNIVEKIGIERAWSEIDDADCILLLIDSTDTDQLSIDTHWPEFTGKPEYVKKLCVVVNKIDLSRLTSERLRKISSVPYCAISAQTGEGLDTLKQHLCERVGLDTTTEGKFSARRRHLDALERAFNSLKLGQTQLQENGAGELLAEDLRQAQEHLGEITGKFSADDLLGEIFSSFCIGK